MVWATIRSGAKLMSSAAKVRTRTGSRMRCEWHSAQLAHSQDHQTDQFDHGTHSISSSVARSKRWLWLPLALETASILRNIILTARTVGHDQGIVRLASSWSQVGTSRCQLVMQPRRRCHCRGPPCCSRHCMNWRNKASRSVWLCGAPVPAREAAGDAHGPGILPLLYGCVAATLLE